MEKAEEIQALLEMYGYCGTSVYEKHAYLNILSRRKLSNINRLCPRKIRKWILCLNFDSMMSLNRQTHCSFSSKSEKKCPKVFETYHFSGPFSKDLGGLSAKLPKWCQLLLGLKDPDSSFPREKQMSNKGNQWENAPSKSNSEKPFMLWFVRWHAYPVPHSILILGEYIT